MARDASPNDHGSETDASDRTQHGCRMTGREQGLVGKYDIWLCRQSFRELAPQMGFKKYD
jgi:small subunit ribosomal protein S14